MEAVGLLLMFDSLQVSVSFRVPLPGLVTQALGFCVLDLKLFPFPGRLARDQDNFLMLVSSSPLLTYPQKRGFAM